MKFLIADDHALIRKGIIEILKEDFSDAEFGEASHFKEIFDHIRNQKWDAVILDITMPGRNGLEVLKQLRTEGFQTPILIVTMHPEDQYAVRVIKSGASGFLSKESATSELGTAVKRILSGRKYIPESIAEKLAEDLATQEKRGHNQLSDREFQVLIMIASGKTVSEIAEYLSLSVPTISTYRTRILDKLKMRTNAELMHFAIRQGLV